MSFLSDLFTAGLRGEKAPDEPRWKKWVHRNLSTSHCEECLKLAGGCFLNYNTPRWPHHRFCHCILEDVPYNEVLTKATAESAYAKFDPYLFDPENFYKHGKAEMLESWGYSITDAKYLRDETERQGLQKYIDGDYQIGLLNEHGQRISIRVEVPRKNGEGTVSFITGWMVKPNGHIHLNTPYGGK